MNNNYLIFQAKEQRKEKQLIESLDIWIDSDDYWICNPCLFHSSSKNVPKQLLVGKKGNFGFVKSFGQKCLIDASKRRHCESVLHEWCLKEFQREAELKTANDQKNELAAKKVVRNVLICFKRSWGSEDFIALNAKDFLAERDQGSWNNATKNDSSAEFFRLRSILFDIVTAKTIRFFADIEDISVTLDKVTVHNISYTVILSYFFNKGKLHIFLNKVHKLSTDQYSGEGTARMLIATLCETFGVSESKLSKILKHLVYDGVYADVEERIVGGGCLELKKHVTNLLGLSHDCMTGNEDYSHNMQLGK